jgi:outer membrane receptor protein involved in Fe transport
MKARILASCAAIALIAGAAHAQTAAADASAAATTPDEIVVTATRRDESVQKVPITIQAFTGKTLSELNVATFNDLLKYTPNVTFGSNGPGAGSIFLRGLSTGFSGGQAVAAISYFPNVALYLDDQSMQFPGHNADIYAADLERVEVLEGPQGTLFGGGAQAGAVRYITNKPKLDRFEGHFEGSAGGTAGGAPNGSFNAAVNIPVIENRLAVRAVVYDDHRGGYIDNVPGTFTRGAFDHYANYLGTPTAANQSHAGQYNNDGAVKKNYNPVDYIGGRVSAKLQINDEWDLLVSEMYQRLDTEGTFDQEVYSPDFVPLKKLQTVTFEPSYSKDTIENTAWTLNGQVGDFHLVYTGAYMVRHLESQQDYTNYSRAFGEYYQCVGSGTGIGGGTPYCYDPYSYWHEKSRNTHMTHELRISTPSDKRIRAIAGGFYEEFRIFDNTDFNYKSTPVCTVELIATNAGCLGLVQPNPDSTRNQPGVRGPKTAFGQDIQRGYDQYAFFGSIDFDILPNLTLTGGTRYYHYKEFQTGSQFQTTAASCAQVLICSTNGVGDVNVDANNDHVRYRGFKSRASLTWRPTDHTTIYGTFSQGFRPGGFNRTFSNILPDTNGTPQYIRPNGYAPDKLTNWELGLKTDLLDHKVQLNLSAYYMDWKNVQIQFFNPTGGFGNTAFVTNGANFHIKGVEAQVAARPFRGASVNAGFTYNDSKQSSSPCLISDYPGSSTFGQCVTSYYRGGVERPVQSPFGAKGSALPYSPHVQADLRLRYDWAGGNALGYWVGGGFTYTGATYNQPSTYPSGEVASASATPGPNGALIPGTRLLRYRMPGYAQFDAQVGVRRDRWTASVFGQNLTNSNASTFTSAIQFIKSEVVLRPLTYGLKLTYEF